MRNACLSTFRRALQQRAFAEYSSTEQTVTSTLEKFGDMFESWSPKDVGDQSGKTFVITGSNAGLGFEVAKELAKKNGHVVMATRSQERAEEAISKIKAEAGSQASVEFLELDLTDFSSIKSAAAKLKGKNISVLANNASVAAPKNDLGAHNKEGFEVTMATNHFGPFLFTQLLLPTLKASAPSRIVYHGASGESMAKVDWDDLKGEKHTDSTLAGEYAQTKLFNIMTAFELDHRFSAEGIDAVACQPGVSHSSIYEKADTSKADVKAIDINQKLAGQSQERGSIPLLYSCTAPELQGNGSKYIGPKYFKGPINLNIGQTKERQPTNPEALDPDQRKRLYDETMRIMQPWL